MFTTGRIVFISFFVLAFVGAMIWAYRKDKNLHLKQYKGAKWILLGFILFLLALLGLKQVLNL
ncbi:hypothetical protein BTO09_10515 [Gilvibacter sp. SZ-19]|jgi:hypothetical protein|nr:hypothetical protein BTO09_10515 [Gilvibacter sp. SZ-19]